MCKAENVHQFGAFGYGIGYKSWMFQKKCLEHLEKKQVFFFFLNILISTFSQFKLFLSDLATSGVCLL